MLWLLWWMWLWWWLWVVVGRCWSLLVIVGSGWLLIGCWFCWFVGWFVCLLVGWFVCLFVCWLWDVGCWLCGCCVSDRVYRHNDQTWSFYLSRNQGRQSQVNSSGNDLVNMSAPSVSVLWMKICDRVATMMCFSSQQRIGLLPSRLFCINNKQNT